MLGSLAPFLTLFAQAAPAAGKPEANPLIQYLPSPDPVRLLLHADPPAAGAGEEAEGDDHELKKNDKVLTAAGMYGTVLSVDEKGDRVQLRLDDDGKVKVTFTKASIVRVVNDPAETN